jgi:hypothetical protein
VGQVGVHLADQVVAPGDPPAHAVAVGDADPGLGRAVQHVHPAELGPDALGDGSGAVGAVVVDHEDVGVGDGRPRAAQELLDVADLVVGRRHDEDAHRRIVRSALQPPRAVRRP